MIVRLITDFGPRFPTLYAVSAVLPTAYAAFSVNIDASSPYLDDDNMLRQDE
jgi:hypothetical protein